MQQFVLRQHFIILTILVAFNSYFSYLFTLIHLFTCIFWFAGTKEPKDSSWITFFGLENQTIFGQYVHTYYFVTTTVLSIGYGDVHPTTFPEIITVIFIELIGVVFYNFLAANFFSLVADPSRNLFLTKYKRVIDGFDHRGVSKESENEIIRYYEYIWEKERIQTDYFQTAKQFPESLQKRISLIMYMNLFNRIGFENIPIKALEKMALAMKPKVFTPGDFIVKAGRVSNHIFFVEEGTVDIFNINGKFVVSFDESKGEIIGENSFLDGNEETANVIAHTYVEAFELSRVDLEDIPEIRETLRNVTNDNQNIQQNEDSP